MAADDDGADRGEEIDGVPAEELVALLSVPPTEFVATRTARVKELKADGERDLANRIGKLRRPSQLVWAVGEIARRDPALAVEAVTAAEIAESATSGGGDLRSALEDLRDVVGRAAAQGSEFDDAVPRPSLALALREVLVDVEARRAWAGGWLLDMPSEAPAPVDELAPRRARRAAEQAAKSESPPTKAAKAAKGRARSTADDQPAIQRGAKADAAPSTKLTVAEASALRAERQKRQKALKKAQRNLTDLEGEQALIQESRDSAQAELDDLEARLSALQVEAEQARSRRDEAETWLTAAAADVVRARAAVEDLERA